MTAIKALKSYATFKGRSQRKEYWYFVLFCLLVGLVAGIADLILGAIVDPDFENGGAVFFNPIAILALMIPSIAVTVRRLHDTGRSGWWWFIVLVPIVGPLVLIYFMTQDSKPGENQYGPNPKGIAA